MENKKSKKSVNTSDATPVKTKEPVEKAVLKKEVSKLTKAGFEEDFPIGFAKRNFLKKLEHGQLRVFYLFFPATGFSSWMVRLIIPSLSSVIPVLDSIGPTLETAWTRFKADSKSHINEPTSDVQKALNEALEVEL